MPTLAGNKQLSVHFFLHRSRLFYHSTEKNTGLIHQKWTSKWLFPHRNNNLKKKQKIKQVFHEKKLLKMHQKINKIHKKVHIYYLKVQVYMCLHILENEFNAWN